ncbi:MAG TPA: 1-deoxy-D-xylulose-5-phosphate synthase [Candidatus Dormibacteraeota bacterium]|nr:1-deoxy-D-xylulose-5-phosphate synthase [Candidatus Dormibacteraeota bacterium]
MVIEGIERPADVKALTRPQLDVLAREIRDMLVVTCSRNGGHLAPNLGVVELTIALHRVLDLPPDKIIWDVSHQSYVHKLLTGRRERFHSLRQGGGISGFSMRSESEYDVFGAGHASTSVSSALGMAVARDLAGRDETIVAVLGDGALTGGLAYEAINNAGQLGSNFIVILNDNEMSIAPNVGSIASYLSILRSKRFANAAREKARNVLHRLPFGRMARKAFTAAEMGAMHFVSPSEKTTVIFEELGFRYMGPVDGHNIDALLEAIATAKGIEGPVLLHVRTVKGKGYEPAEKDSRTFHGCGAFDVENGKLEVKPNARATFSDAFADAMNVVAAKDARVIGITAAMPDGTKLAKFGKKFPERFFDVGIAEAHAVCFAAGAASAGLRPVCAIYSTFLQRAYDQVVHDVCVQELPVVFCMDRAGLVGDDGPTHMGLYDIAYLRALPGMTIMAPRCEEELLPMLEHALTLDRPAAIRYPRGSSTGRHEDAVAPIEHGKAEVLRRGEGVAVLALGNTVDVALDAYDLLETLRGHNGRKPTVVNARFARPLDEGLLEELARTHDCVMTLEEHSLAGGYGSAVVEWYSDRGIAIRVERVGIPSVLVQHDSQPRQRVAFGLSAELVAERIAQASREGAARTSGAAQSLRE